MALSLKNGLFIWVLLSCPLIYCQDLKIMAANLTSGPQQSYDQGHGTRIFQGLKPDVVLIQEFNIGDNSDAAISTWVADTFGQGYHYFRESENGGIPNGIISRLPFKETGEWADGSLSNRDFAWARIDLPGEKELWAISVHLKAGGAAGTRAKETAALMRSIRSQVPEGDYVVLGGDFNTSNRNEQCIKQLSSYFETGAPWPADQSGNGNTNASRKKPYDWVLFEKELAEYEVPITLGNQTYEQGIVFDSRVFNDLASVSPVQREDSRAPQMQHMAVMRAFRIDAETSDRAADGRRLLNLNGNRPTLAENLPDLSDKRNLIISIIDVEKGDATLIVCPEDQGKRDLILIDSGEDDDHNRILKEIGDRGFPLEGKPIRRFIITHYDSDHHGSAPELIPLAQLILDHGDNNIQSSREPHDVQYLRAVNQPGVERQTVTLDYKETFSGGVTLECVAVNQATSNDRTKPPSKDENTNSIALVLSYKGFDYFTGGDLTKVPETSLAESIRNVDVYHVNHHGSNATSSTKKFIAKLDPEVSIASNGTKYGHPRASVAKRLVALGSQWFQTNNNESFWAYHPPEQYVADDTYFSDKELENREGAKGTIRIHVRPEGGKYYVVMPGLPLAEGIFEIEVTE